MIKLSGDDFANTIKQWMMRDIVESPNLRSNLGKFFFSIAAMSLGFFTGVVKIDQIPIHTSAILMFIFSFLSLIIVVFMVLPKIHRLTGGEDLRRLYIQHNKKSFCFIVGWFVTWFLSVISGIIAVFQLSG